MLRTVGEQPSLWESVLPAEVLVMPAELAAVDRLLDDPRFFEPFRAFFHPVLGRPSIPMETYLRLMFLKYRYQLGFEPLCREVSDSITWLRFCRIPLGGRAPHPTTLMKITSRCGERAVAELNEALLAKAAEARVLKVARVRADTTVIEANVAYPTDSGLMTKGITAIAKAAARVREAGLARRTRFRDRTRSARARCRAINANLRRRSDEAQADVRRINAEIVRIARATARQAEAVARNARRGLRSAGRVDGRVTAAVDRLTTLARRVAKVAEQCSQRLAGHHPEGATRIVSMHDAEARAIRKGRIGKPVEFGYKAQVVDNDDGVVVDWQVEAGNPTDAPQLAPAIARVARRAGRAPRVVTADRGYGEATVDHDLHALGVTHVVIPRKGRPSQQRHALEQQRPFRRHVRWRTGAEGRISCLKRDYGCRRTRMDTLAGARTWTGHGILAHNLVKIAGLLA